MVACHGELAQFFFNNEVSKFLLLGELIAETNTLVIDSKAQVHLPMSGSLFQGHQEFVVVVKDLTFFPPYRFPCFLEGSLLSINYFELLG